MRLMKLKARSRNAFPNKSTKASEGDTAMGQVFPFEKQIAVSQTRAAIDQKYPIKGTPVAKAVWASTPQVKSLADAKAAEKRATFSREVTKLVVEQVKTQRGSSGSSASDAEAPSHTLELIDEPTTMAVTSSPTTRAAKTLGPSQDTEPTTLAVAVEPDSVSSPSISISDVVSEVRRIRIAMESIAEVLAESMTRKRASAKLAPQIDPEILKSFKGKELLNMREVEALVGAKRSTIYGWMKEGNFVKSVKLSPKATRFIASEVADWLDAHKAGGSEISKPNSDLQR